MKFVQANLYKLGHTPNAYNEQIETWSVAQPIEMFFYYSNGLTAVKQDVLTCAYQLVGLTKASNIAARDKITYDGKTYLVKSVIPTKRLYEVFLEEDKAV